MLSFPNAKINLGLNIVAKRTDGFHDIETVFYPVGWKDALEIIPSKNKSSSLHLSGIKVDGNASDNLCIRAYELLNTAYGLPPVEIHLHKAIPTGAGLGGGSADAAFTLKLLNEMFELNLAWGELHYYAKQLGADCSFFITNKPVFAQGKGDDLEGISLSLKNYHLFIVHPGIHLNTAEAYAGVVPEKPKTSVKDIVQRPVSEWRDTLVNDFEKTVFRKFPEIEKLKQRLYDKGAVYASMSGSGSAVFGIFEKQVEMEEFSGFPKWCGPATF